MESSLELLHRGVRPKASDPADCDSVCSGAPRLLERALTPARLRRLKFAYTTRHLNGNTPDSLLVGELRPRAGDLVLARVDQLGQHKRLELRDGRRALLFPGDEIIVCYGNRYAPDQFEAELPDDLSPCNLVAAGGIAARELSRHVSVAEATRITPLGLLAAPDAAPLNLKSFKLDKPNAREPRPPTLAVVGSAMNAGKTTTAANLVKGLVAAGWKAGAAKVTGTGAGGDVWFLTDAGASPVLDFTAAGLPSTYLAGAEAIERTFRELVGHLAAAKVDVIVVEVADGICHQETRELLESEPFDELVDGVLFAATDALSAAAAVDYLSDRPVPLLAISGMVSASPLAAREAETITGLTVIDIAGLRDPEQLAGLVAPRVASVAA
jgi:molybdopterin-guanine dinucleotide biosynthesis protein